MSDQYLDGSTVVNLVYTGQATRMRDEYARLMSDLKKLRHERIHDINQIGGLQQENARLKAEVEMIYRIDPLIREAVASALLASKEVHP